jgi:hypothetical protein
MAVDGNQLGLGLDPFAYLSNGPSSAGRGYTTQADAAGAPDRASASGSNNVNSIMQGLSKQAQKNIETQNKISREEIAARLKIAEMQIGSTNTNAAAQIAVERERIEQSRQEMERLGVPRLELDKWKAQKDAELQSAALDLDKERLVFEKDKTAQQLEFDKAKWRDENANEVRKLDFDEKSFDQNLQFEREREAGRLGLDTQKYVSDKAEQDRRYAMDLQSQGFTQGIQQGQLALDVRKQTAQESQFAATHAEDARRFNATIAEDARKFDLTTAEGRRQFDLTFGEGARQFDLTTAEGQRQYNESMAQRQYEFGTNTALDVAKTSAGMGGPGDWAAKLDFDEGVRNTGDVPVFVQRLLNPNAGGGGSATGPTPPSRTLAGVAANIAGVPQSVVQQAGQQAQMRATGAAPGSPEASAQQVAGLVRANPPSNGGGWNDRDLAILDQIEKIYAQPGKTTGYEQMSDDQKAFLEGGAKKRGGSRNTFETKYYQSRVGQGSAAA